MKTNFLKIILIFSLTLASCNESRDENLVSQSEDLSILSKSQIENATMIEKLNYKRHHLKLLATWVSSQKDVISSLEINQHGENEPTSYKIESLFNQQLNSKKNAEDVASNFKDLITALDAFKDLDGETWYPTVFIRGSDSKTRKSSSNSRMAYVAIEDADENGEVYTAYELLDNDNELELSPLNEELTPDLVGSSSLMVVELSLCGADILIDHDGDIDTEDMTARFFSEATCGDNFDTGDASRPIVANVFLVINKMTIKDLKEGWPGRSEISFKGYKITNINKIAYDCNLPIYASVNCWTWEGNRITRLKRRHKNRERTYDWIIKTDSVLSDYIYYVIFEQDSWPAYQKFAVFSFPFPGNAISRIPYRTWQGKYDQQTLSQNPYDPYGLPYANNFSTDNNYIKYNLKIK